MCGFRSRLRATIPLCTGVTVFLMGFAAAGCDGEEPNVAEIPEMAAVEVEPGALEVTPGEIELRLADIELEEVLPLDADDAGKMIMASGYVIGQPLGNGFFLLTEAGRVLFVETDTPAMPGDIVRTAGLLQAATAPVFEGWEVDAFELEGGVVADWDVQRTWYIDASLVEIYRRVNEPQGALAPGAPTPDSR